MIFTPPDTALIELQAVPYDFGPFYNGKSFVQKWILSFGHKPYNISDLVKVMESCSDHNATICPWDTRSHFIQSDLIVNITKLKKDLESAVTFLCPSASMIHYA
jgi:hypothetical protein